MNYSEEKEFTVRLVMRCNFPDDYEGELDGYAWAEEVPAVAGEVVRAVIGVLGKHRAWKLHGGNRGRSPEDEVTLVLERQLDREGPAEREGG